jgi:trehalose 6-phosphate synthase
VIVLANRAPYRLERDLDGLLRLKRSASGLVTALEPVVEAFSGVWVAHREGSAAMQPVDGPHDTRSGDILPSYRLHGVSLADDEYRGYYYGFANEGLWPLCHALHVPPVFRSSDFHMYQRANTRFVAAVCDEAGGRSPLVFVQDYHFALAPRMLRERLPMSRIVTFWHIPWPNPREFRLCPWRYDILNGLLGSDVVGFQTPTDCRNFLETVARVLKADVDRFQKAIEYRGQLTRVRAYPVGVAWPNESLRALPESGICRESVCRDLQLPAGVRLGVGVDRLDYTKGITEKFLALERLLETHPEWRGRLVFVQIAEPSRECLPAYRAARTQLLEISERVNQRFGDGTYRPIRVLDTHHAALDVYRYYRAADFCYVGSLRDGMNLVAKEFVCARNDLKGVLVLSEFAGAAQQLDAALHVNPYQVDAAAAVLARALSMPEPEQSTRMQAMRNVVTTFAARNAVTRARQRRRTSVITIGTWSRQPPCHGSGALP